MNKTRAAMTIIVLLLTLPLAAAWGISPARQRATYTEEQQTLSITIENPEKLEGYFKVEFTGALAQYAHYSSKIAYLDKNTPTATVPFTLKLPRDLPPGTNSLTVTFKQLADQETSTVGSLTTLIADVTVDVPVQGNHVTAQLSVGQSKETEETPITISIINKGEADIAVWADISIKGPTNQELASWQTEKTIIEYLGTGKIMTAWQGEKEPGAYAIDVQLHYADKTLKLRGEFTVGGKEVVSEGVSSSTFKLGSIVPLNIRVRNTWNGLIEDVYADVYVLTKEGTIVQDFKTLTTDIEALGRTVLTGYWDTEKLVVGGYDVNVVVNYEGEKTQKTYPVVVKMDELQVDQATGEVIGDRGEGGIGQYSLLIILIAVLIATNVTIIIYFKRMRKKK